MNQIETARSGRRANVKFLSILALAIAVSGCNSRKPEGQTIAIVNGKPITELQLNMELANISPDKRKALRKQALDGLIERMLLVDAAKERKLDRTPEFTLQIGRLTDTLLAQQYVQSIGSSAHNISDAQLNSYIAAHPEIGENRRVYKLEQVMFSEPSTAALRKQLEETKSLPDLISVLQTNRMTYQPNQASMDSAMASAEILKTITGLAPGEPFVLLNGGQAIASSIVGMEAKPSTSEEISQIAQRRLESEQTLKTLSQQMSALKVKAKIEYSKEFSAKGAASAPVAAE